MRKNAGTRTRVRRSPLALRQALLDKIEKIQQVAAARVTKLQERINALETKYQKRIALEEILASKTPEEIQAEFEALQHKTKVLRKARKLVTTTEETTQPKVSKRRKTKKQVVSVVSENVTATEPEVVAQ